MMSTDERPRWQFRRSLWIVPLVGYWIALFTATHLPINPDIVVPGNDKTLHVVGYAGLGFLFGLALFPRLFTAAILPAYALFDELTQPLVGRTCDIYDGFADVAGMTIGLSLAAAAAYSWERLLSRTGWFRCS